MIIVKPKQTLFIRPVKSEEGYKAEVLDAAPADGLTFEFESLTNLQLMELASITNGKENPLGALVTHMPQLVKAIHNNPKGYLANQFIQDVYFPIYQALQASSIVSDDEADFLG